MEEIEEIKESHSEEIQDIIGRVPNWILRYGLLFLFFIIVAIFLGAYFIQYPDTLDAKITITAQNPPVYITPKINGKIKNLYVKDNETVVENQILATMASNVDIDSLKLFKELVVQMNITENIPIDTLESLLKHESLFFNASLISMQANEFAQAIKNYIFIKNDNSYYQKIANATAQIKFQKKLQQKLKTQTSLAKQKLKYEQTKVDANKYLHDSQIVSEIDMNDFQKNLLDQKLSYENFSAAIFSNQVNIEQINQVIISLNQQEKERKANAILRLQQSKEAIVSTIENWEQNYIIKTNTSGKIVFLKAWSASQDVSTNEPAFIVVSPIQKIIGKALVPIYKTAKMKIGQTVNIKLANYQFEQYGILKGKVEQIAAVPFQENYIVNVSLPQNLITTYHKQLQFYPEMKGDAQIVLKEERLLFKLLYKFKREIF